MRVNKQIFKYKFYQNIIVSYIILIIVTVTLLSSILFYFFSTSSTKEIDQNLKSMLTQMSYASNVVYDQVLTISNQLNMDNEIITYTNSYQDDIDSNKVINYDIYNRLSSIQAMYPFISSIGLYNVKNNIYIDSKNIPIDKSLINQNSEKYLLFYPRKITSDANSNMLNLLTFVLHPDFSLSSYTRSAIVINIDQQYIVNTILNINKKAQDSTIFVMDSKGQILSDADSSYFMKNFASKIYVKNILKDKMEDGSFTVNIENRKQLVTYVKANDLNWYFVSVKPYNKLISNIYELRNITFLIALLLVLIGVFMSLLLTGIVYNPMKSLMVKIGINNNLDLSSQKFDEYKILSEAFSKSQLVEKSAISYISSSSKVIKEGYLLNLIKGNVNESLVSTEIIKKFADKLTAPYFCTILFKIDNFNRFKEKNDMNEQSLNRFAICNIIQDLFENHDCVVTEENEVVLLIQLTKNILNDNILLTLSGIQDVLKKYFSFTVSISIGNIVNSKDDICLSYKSSLEYIKYRLFYGYGCILDVNMAKKNLMSVVKYPFSIEKKIIETIQLGNKSTLSKHIDEFIKSISNSNYYQAVNYSSQLITTMYRQFENSTELLSEHISNITKINNSETLEDISNIIQEFCDEICSILDEKNNKISSQKYKLIIDKAETYIKDNYADPNLSLELISDIINLSPAYLGKIFKSIKNMAFNEYLNNIRLEKSKELLSSTNMPSSKICEAVGIYNVTYFSTLFKKTYGLTPSQFRRQFTKD